MGNESEKISITLAAVYAGLDLKPPNVPANDLPLYSQGYATALGFGGHSVGETVEDVEALIAASPAFQGPGILVPTQHTSIRLVS